jgi:hypothetical protein
VETSYPNRLIFLIFYVNENLNYFIQVSPMPQPLKTPTAGTEFLRVPLLSLTFGGCQLTRQFETQHIVSGPYFMMKSFVGHLHFVLTHIRSSDCVPGPL